jgi:hypothetical protein
MSPEQFSPGERIVVEIISVSAVRQRINMSYVGPAPHETLTDVEQITLEMLPYPSEGGE